MLLLHCIEVELARGLTEEGEGVDENLRRENVEGGVLKKKSQSSKRLRRGERGSRL